MIAYLSCPRDQWPPCCAETFQTEGDLIAHYIARHHSPTEDAYTAACEALRQKTADLARALPIVAAAEALVDEWYYRPQEGSAHADSNEAHFEVLEAAVLAARKLDAGKGTG